MRVYSEQEVSQILERATARQRQRQQQAPEPGLTLDDLERIGAEVGIDPASLRAAAAEVDAAGGVSQRRSRSAAHIYVERWVPGALTEAAWEDVVAELQNRFGKAGMQSMMPMSGTAGRVEQVGRNREWVHTDALGVETRVLVSDRGDRVRLRLSQRVGLGTSTTDGVVVGLSLGWIPGIIAAALAVGGGPLSPAWTIPCVLAGMLLVGLATFALDRPWRNRMHDRLDALADSLADLVAPPVGAQAPAARITTAAESAPAVSLEDLAEVPPVTEASRAPRTRA